MFGSNKRKYEIALNGWAQEILSLNPFLRGARIDYIKEFQAARILGIDVDPEANEVIDDLISKINLLPPSYPPGHMATDAANFIINTTLECARSSEDIDERE